MKMENTHERIMHILDVHHEKLNGKITFYDREKLNHSVSGFFLPGNSYQYVYDVPTQKFIYFNRNNYEGLSLDLEGLTRDDYLQLVHPEDVQHIDNCMEVTNYFFFNYIDKADISNYKVTFQFRIKDKHDNYKTILHQGMPLSISEGKQVQTILASETDISHITTSNNYKVSFIDIKSNKSFWNISDKDDFQRPTPDGKTITNREMDVLRLLMDGYSSKEIAGQLFISYDTVRTHRNNILKKTKFRTLTQVISYYIKEGLL